MTSIYEIEGEGGRIIEVEGDRPPTKEEAQKAFGLADAEEGRAKKEADRAPLLDKISEAVSSALLTRKGVVKAILSGGGKVGDVAADVVPAIGGSIAGAVAGPGGAAAGGAAGGTAGNLLRQTREYFRGERDDFSKGQAVAAAAMGAVPAGGAAKTVAGTVALRGAQGAGLGVGAKAVETLIDRKELPSWGEVGFAAGGGLIFGGALGGLEKGVPAIVSKLRSQLEGKTPAEASAVLTKAIETADPADQPPLLALRDFVGEKMGIVTAKPSAAESAARKADVTAAIVADETPGAIDAQIGLKPASPELGALNAKLAGQEAEGNAVASASALERAAESRISPDDTLMLGGDPAKEQVTNLDVRLGADTGATAERARLGAEIDASAPKVEGGDIPAGVQLSPQAQRIAEEYGFVAPKLAAALAGGGSGLAVGVSQDGTPDERIKRGLTYAVIGAGGGYALGRTFAAAVVPKLPPGQYPDIDRWYSNISPPEGAPLAERMATWPNRIREAVVTKFAPLDRLESQIAKANPGSTVIPSPLPMSRKFEQVAGASGKGLQDVQDFERAVISQIQPSEARDFDVLLAVKRTGQRLQWNHTIAIDQARIAGIPAAQRTPAEIATLAKNADLKRVGGEDLASVDRALQQLEAKLGTKRFAELDQLAAGSFQQELDENLRLQVTSGRLSPEAYAGIKASNDFYAPFRVLRASERFDGAASAGAIDTRRQIAKAIEGIDDPNFHLDSPTRVAAEQIFNGRVLAEKNLKMLELARLADLDTSGTVIRKLRPGQEPRAGYHAVNYFDSGVPMHLEVDAAVARAVKGLNATQTGVIGSFAQSLGSVFRFGATSANAAFQVRNLVAADQPRLLLLSKYGVQLDPREAYQIPIDFVHALYASVLRNVAGKDTQLARAFYESGAAGSTLQDAISRIGGRFEATKVTEAAVNGGRSVIDTLQDFTRVLEETTKMMGFKRGVRIEGIDKLPPAQAAAKLEEIVSEIRNFAGSPDFARHGGLAKDMNMLFIFFNARLQGVTSDLTRLAGGDGGKAARDSWIRLGATAGVASAYFWYRNQDPENKADFESLSQRDRENFLWIPRYDEDGAPLYGVDAQGKKFREFFTVPKRESAKTISNLTQAALDFAASKDPAAVATFGVNFIEDISPINITGRNGTERVESAIGNLNPLLRVPFEIIANRDTFRHAPIVPAEFQGGTDPTQQYFTGRTPDLYVKAAKLMPQGLWDPMRSPLMLQQAVQGLTGGLVSQFTRRSDGSTRDPTTSALAANPFTKVFVGTPFRRDDGAVALARDVKGKSIDARLTVDHAAETEFGALQAMPTTDRRARLERLAAEKPELFGAVLDEFERRQKGFDAADRIAARLGVQDGARAEYLRQRIGGLAPADRRAFIEDQFRKKILTDEVWEQILTNSPTGRN
ncbi:LPD38 domain-containing protein [Horticoccus sp. 23ND18S-11]|uniref:LPD38 domain-containing protein n=1 Tax=Horticoccus sp. 23ND18S-11 TaxID=3391832 RepID=UPI0039C99CAC